MAEADLIDRDAGETDMGAQLDPVGDQVGLVGGAEHDIGQTLTPEAEIGDVVTRGDVALGKEAVDIVARDRLALRPQHEQRDRDQRQSRQQDDTSALAARRGHGLGHVAVVWRHAGLSVLILSASIGQDDCAATAG